MYLNFTLKSSNNNQIGEVGNMWRYQWNKNGRLLKLLKLGDESLLYNSVYFVYIQVFHDK